MDDAAAAWCSLDRVFHVLHTVAKDVWSANFMDEAQSIYEKLEEALQKDESALETTWVAMRPHVRRLLGNFIRTSSFQPNQEAHVHVQALHAQLARVVDGVAGSDTLALWRDVDPGDNGGNDDDNDDEDDADENDYEDGDNDDEGDEGDGVDDEEDGGDAD
jgi:hypothetical protein